MTGPQIKKLSGSQNRRLTEALLSAFPALTQLERMVKWGLDQDLAFIAGGVNLTDVVFDLLTKWAEPQGKTGELILAARAVNPGNPKLSAIAAELDLSLKVPNALERLLVKGNGIVDYQRLGQLQYQVCKVRAGKQVGTGFLIGPDLIITNYHVVQDLLQDQITASQVSVLFDYLRLPGHAAPNQGTPCDLAEDWRVDDAPPSAEDSKVLADKGPVDPGHLDYAVLKLAQAMGDDPVAALPAAPPRGWLRGAAAPQPGAPLIIAQHPLGKPLSLAFGETLACNDNQTRVRYDADTEKGSSGSPCLDARFDLVALHHSGDPEDQQPGFNEGIPWPRIVERLAQKGVTLPPPPKPQ